MSIERNMPRTRRQGASDHIGATRGRTTGRSVEGALSSCSVVGRIDALPERIWEALTDPDVLIAGDGGIIRIEGSISLNSRFRLWSEVAGGVAFSVTVTVFDHPCRMEWRSVVPSGRFFGVRRFTLARDGSATVLTIAERFSGLLPGPISRSTLDLTPSLEGLMEALKQAAVGSDGLG